MFYTGLPRYGMSGILFAMKILITASLFACLAVSSGHCADSTPGKRPLSDAIGTSSSPSPRMPPEEPNKVIMRLMGENKPEIGAIRVQLEKGADPNLTSNAGEIPLLVTAIIHSDTRGAKAERDSPLKEELTVKWVEVMKLLLDYGANPNGTYGESETTPLMQAAALNVPDAVGLLLEHKADANAMTSKGMTPLVIASGNGSVAIMKQLVAAGADVNAGTDDKPLHAAVRQGGKEAVEYLLSCKADINAKNKDGKTPLGVAEELSNHKSSDNYRVERLKPIIDFLREKGGVE